MRTLFWVAGAVLLLASGCEDALSVEAERSVHLASLPDRSLTIELPANGTVSPVGTQTIKDGQSLELQASASAGFTFYRWEKVSGKGVVEFDDDSKTSTAVRVSGGDAVVRAVIDDTVFDVTVASQTGGSTSQTILPGLNKGAASPTITASPSANYHFVNWTVSSGAGITFSPSATSASVTVTANSGDATVQANFAANTYATTFQTMAGVSTTTAGSRTLEGGVLYSLEATVSAPFVFDGWEKVSGTGTVSFDSPASPSTTVSVTSPWTAGATLVVRAKTRRESLSLAQAGETASPPYSTYPSDLAAAWYDRKANYLYLTGTSSAGGGALRRWDLKSPESPTSSGNDYVYLSGAPSALVGDGVNLYFATSTKLGRLVPPVPSGQLSGWSLSPTPKSISGITDVVLEPVTSSLAVVRGGIVALHKKADLTVYSSEVAAYSGFAAQKAVAGPYGLFTIYEDNGANLLQGVDVYDQDRNSYTTAPHNGADMDPGSAGKPVMNAAGTYLALPVEDEVGTSWVQIYGTSAPWTVEDGWLSRVSVSGTISSVTWAGPYIVAAGSNAGAAAIWIIDAYDPEALMLRKSVPIAGFTVAPYAFYDGTVFWVVLDTPTSELTIRSYSVTRS